MQHDAARSGELPRSLFDDARILLVDGRTPNTDVAAAEKAKALGITVLLDAAGSARGWASCSICRTS